jgi:phospholipid-binding lipoprotein MlaA
MLASQSHYHQPHHNQCLRSALLLAVFLFLSACAQQKPTDDSTQPAVHTSTEVSASSTMTIQTSQGSFELEPTVVSYAPQTFSDPLESINRPIFAFNDLVFRYMFIPLAKGYQKVVPSPVRSGVSNFFSNVREPLNALNHVLQGEGKASGSSLSRFVINSTLGIFGLFDPANDWFAIKEQKATLNQTLASYDVGYGSFLVLPFLGQTDTRNGFSTVVEGIIHPINLATDSPQTLYIQGYSSFHAFSPQSNSYEKLKQHTEDPYLFFRNLYLQGVLRDQQFSEKTLPEESFELNPHSSGHQPQQTQGLAEQVEK